MILVGHGSKAKHFDKAMLQVLAALKRQKKFFFLSTAYLEINSPSIPDAITEAIKHGAEEVRVLPYFLLTGRHVVEDIPKIISEAKKQHAKKASVVLCPYLGYDPKIVALVEKRISQRVR